MDEPRIKDTDDMLMIKKLIRQNDYKRSTKYLIIIVCNQK